MTSTFAVMSAALVLAHEEGAAGDPVASLLTGITVFVLAIFVGFEVITKVPPTLHTPLMSGSNAISGVTIIGAILCAGEAANGAGAGASESSGITFGNVLGLIAVVLATVNVVGGFMVTNRMLQMFKSKKKK